MSEKDGSAEILLVREDPCLKNANENVWLPLHFEIGNLDTVTVVNRAAAAYFGIRLLCASCSKLRGDVLSDRIVTPSY